MACSLLRSAHYTIKHSHSTGKELGTNKVYIVWIYRFNLVIFAIDVLQLITPVTLAHKMTTQILQLTPSILFLFQIVNLNFWIMFVLQEVMHFWTEQAHWMSQPLNKFDLFRSGIENGFSQYIFTINSRHGRSALWTHFLSQGFFSIPKKTGHLLNLVTWQHFALVCYTRGARVQRIG